ncbi:hypothetical protein EDB92DRAFT_1939844 [Lactarius akahatsu]|uniref:Uncharacterized protein n=1 Tax=Lactarius akahatsu TaxID=416441 RepID=A0AAD4LTH6_9AGAM|nr:hypothetical protein EDB92DRAFT_1939844 [Lactarius akahatsu]
MSDLQSSKHPITLCPSLATRSKSRRTNYACSTLVEKTDDDWKVKVKVKGDDQSGLVPSAYLESTRRVTGKITLASRRDTRIEVVQLRERPKDHSANDQELYHRARGLLLLDVIFKSTVPGESDEERRELEPDGRCQAEEKAGAAERYGASRGENRA